MPSSNKTPLGFNQWAEDDKPKRADFVADNALIDRLLGTHMQDAAKHLSADDRVWLREAVQTGSYAGDGKAERALTLPFAPRFAVVFAALRAPVAFSGDKNALLVNCGVATSQYGSMGIDVTGNVLTVYQGAASAGAAENLNRSGESYYYAIFR